MPESDSARRRPTNLSAETKWEIFLQVTAGEISQAEAARKWRVDVSTVIGIRRTVKDAALSALARKSGASWRATGLAARGRPGGDSGSCTRRSRRRPSSWRSCGENRVGAERAGAGAGSRQVRKPS